MLSLDMVNLQVAPKSFPLSTMPSRAYGSRKLGFGGEAIDLAEVKRGHLMVQIPVPQPFCP